MDLGRLILADPQPPEVVQPRQGPLHVPAIFPQPAPVRRPPPRDVRTDAAPAQRPAMRVRVVAPIAIQAARPASGPARPAAYRWDRVHERDHRIDVGDIGGRRLRHQWYPARIGDDLVLAPLLATVDGARAGPSATAASPHEAAVDQRPIPVDPIRLVQLGQEPLVELLPDPGLVPVAEPPPAGHAATAAHLPGEILPVDAGLQDEQDAGQRLAVVDRLAAGEAAAARLVWREQRLQPLPERAANPHFVSASNRSGQVEYRPRSPILIATDDAATIGLRFCCKYKGSRI